MLDFHRSTNLVKMGETSHVLNFVFNFHSTGNLVEVKRDNIESKTENI